MYQQFNYVSFDNTECQVIGTSFKDKIYNLKNQIEIKSIKNWCDVGWKYEDDISPIPLTKDVLIRLGFVENGNHLDFNEFCFISRKEGVFLWSNPKPDYNIRFIHELQNWYLSKTGEVLVFC